jgi:hypothetical protein
MSLYKYISNAWQIAEELLEALSNEDVDELRDGVDELRDDLAKMGEPAWLAWVAENHKTVFSILGATPERRAKRKDCADPVRRRRLYFAAYHRARLAALTLSAAEQLRPGGSYRSTCQVAAYAGEEILKEARWFWPFGDELPFAGWQPPQDLNFVVSGSCVLRPDGSSIMETRVCGIRVDKDAPNEQS